MILKSESFFILINHLLNLKNVDVSIDTIGATRTVGRDLELIVKGYATGSNLDDTLDRIWKEVEGAYSGDIKVRTLIRNNIAFD